MLFEIDNGTWEVSKSRRLIALLLALASWWRWSILAHILMLTCGEIFSTEATNRPEGVEAAKLTPTATGPEWQH
jgi:hypothetical protein